MTCFAKDFYLAALSFFFMSTLSRQDHTSAYQHLPEYRRTKSSLLAQQKCHSLNTKKRGNSAEITRLLLILKSLKITYILYSKGESSDANKENLVYLFFQQKNISVAKETKDLYIGYQCFLTLEVCVTSLKHDKLVF
jgi:hypothetical protein